MLENRKSQISDEITEVLVSCGHKISRSGLTGLCLRLLTYHVFRLTGRQASCVISISVKLGLAQSDQHKIHTDGNFPRTTVANMVAGPAAWNQLPQTVRQAQTQPHFKRLLKTFLFNEFL